MDGCAQQCIYMQDRNLAAKLTYYSGRYFHYDFVLNWLRKKAYMLSCHKQVHTSLSQNTEFTAVLEFKVRVCVWRNAVGRHSLHV